MLRDLSLSAVVAGFVAVLVGFTSSVVIVFQAAAAFGATPAQATSWMWALGLGMALTSIGLSLRYRQPVLTAWSTPGAAVLVTSAAENLHGPQDGKTWLLDPKGAKGRPEPRVIL